MLAIVLPTPVSLENVLRKSVVVLLLLVIPCLDRTVIAPKSDYWLRPIVSGKVSRESGERPIGMAIEVRLTEQAGLGGWFALGEEAHEEAGSCNETSFIFCLEWWWDDIAAVHRARGLLKTAPGNFPGLPNLIYEGIITSRSSHVVMLSLVILDNRWVQFRGNGELLSGYRFNRAVLPPLKNQSLLSAQVASTTVGYVAMQSHETKPFVRNTSGLLVAAIPLVTLGLLLCARRRPELGVVSKDSPPV